MNLEIFVGLLQNGAILLATTLLYDIFWSSRSDVKSVRYGIVAGLIIGLVAILLMMTPWTMSPGLFFDTRSVLYLNSALFMGPIATVVAALVGIVYRAYIGGSGVYMGIATIVLVSVVSIIWKKIFPNWRKSKDWVHLLSCGFICHTIVLSAIILLSDSQDRVTMVKNMSIPFLILYPLISLSVGKLLINRIENHKVRQKLELSDARYESFIDTSEDMIFMKDNSRKYIVVNSNFCKALSKQKYELIDNSDDTIFTGEMSKKYYESDLYVINSKKTVRYEEVFPDKVTETVKFPISLGYNITGVAAIIRDITSKYKMRELQEVLLYLSRLSLVDNDLDVFLQKVHFNMKKVINADNFYIALYNKEDETYSYPYFIDQKESIEPGFKEQLKGSLTDYVRIMGKGLLVTPEVEKEINNYYPLKVYGEYSQVWMGAPLMDSGLKEVIGVAVVQDYRDVAAYTQEDFNLFEIFANTIGTYIEKLEFVRKLQKAKESAESSDRFKTIFLANVTHDIRTPLNGIIGFSDILQSELDGEEHKEYASIINSSAHKLLYTINSVMDIAKIEAGEITVIKENFCLVELVKDLNRFFAKNPKSKVKIIMSTPLDVEKFEIYSDKMKLEQILINLINNSLKFTINGFVEFGFKFDNNSYTIYVKDTGIGISKENQKMIFERFKQVDTHQKVKAVGTGLGLSIVKEFSELLNGEISLESELDRGSIFMVKFSREQ